MPDAKVSVTWRCERWQPGRRDGPAPVPGFGLGELGFVTIPDGRRVMLPGAYAHTSCVAVDPGGRLAWVGTRATGDPWEEPTVVTIDLDAGEAVGGFRIWGDSTFWPYVGVAGLAATADWLAIGLAARPPEKDDFGMLWIFDRQRNRYATRDHVGPAPGGPVTWVAFAGATDSPVLWVGRRNPDTWEEWRPVG